MKGFTQSEVAALNIKINELLEKSIEIYPSNEAFKSQMINYSFKANRIAEEDINLGIKLINVWEKLIENNFTGFFSIEDEVYHLTPGLSQTSAKRIKRSPAKYFYEAYKNTEKMESKAMDEGSFIHDLVLTPENIGKYYNDDELIKWVLEQKPELSKPRASALYKEQKTEIEKEGKTLIDGKLFNNSNQLLKVIEEDNFFNRLLDGAMLEKACYAICQHSGLLIRGKFDALTKELYIFDLKTIDSSFDIDEDGVAKRIGNLKNNIQASHYENLIESAIGKKSKGYLFGFIERRMPFDYFCGQMDEASHEKSDSEYFDMLAQIKDCYIKNEWPKKNSGINKISMPHWFFTEK